MSFLATFVLSLLHAAFPQSRLHPHHSQLLPSRLRSSSRLAREDGPLGRPSAKRHLCLCSKIACAAKSNLSCCSASILDQPRMVRRRGLECCAVSLCTGIVSLAFSSHLQQQDHGRCLLRIVPAEMRAWCIEKCVQVGRRRGLARLGQDR
jgi:hypothetical protein